MENTVKQILNDLEHQRYQFLLNEDYKSFENICHPELMYVHASGKIDNFNGYIDKCKQGFYQYKKVELVVERINYFDSVALIFSDLKSEFLAGSEPKRLHNKILSVWVLIDGKWKFFSYQPTPII